MRNPFAHILASAALLSERGADAWIALMEVVPKRES